MFWVGFYTLFASINLLVVRLVSVSVVVYYVDYLD